MTKGLFLTRWLKGHLKPITHSIFYFCNRWTEGFQEGIPLQFCFVKGILCFDNWDLKLSHKQFVLKKLNQHCFLSSNSPLERGWGVCFHLKNIKLNIHITSISFKICSSLNLKTAIPIRSFVFLHSILFIDFKIHENNHRLQSQASIRDKKV
jgi:hypothetical protein